MSGAPPSEGRYGGRASKEDERGEIIGVRSMTEERISMLGAGVLFVVITYFIQGAVAWENIPKIGVVIRIQWISSTVGWFFLQCNE